MLLQIGAASFYYKLGQVVLQIGAAFLLQLGQVLLQIGAAFFITIGASVITNKIQ